MQSIDFSKENEDFEDHELFLKFLSKKYMFTILKELQVDETIRFTKLVKNLGNISTKPISNRLKELVEYELVSREL